VVAVEDDRELIRESLRAVLRSGGSSGKALAAKSQAARQLALLNGEPVVAGNRGEVRDDDAPYPHADLWEIEDQRRERARKRGTRQVAASARNG
jgi:hypothetical protein